MQIRIGCSASWHIVCPDLAQSPADWNCQRNVLIKTRFSWKFQLETKFPIFGCLETEEGRFAPLRPVGRGGPEKSTAQSWESWMISSADCPQSWSGRSKLFSTFSEYLPVYLLGFPFNRQDKSAMNEFRAFLPKSYKNYFFASNTQVTCEGLTKSLSSCSIGHTCCTSSASSPNRWFEGLGYASGHSARWLTCWRTTAI